jgi:hypothetical protein
MKRRISPPLPRLFFTARVAAEAFWQLLYADPGLQMRDLDGFGLVVMAAITGVLAVSSRMAGLAA